MSYAIISEAMPLEIPQSFLLKKVKERVRVIRNDWKGEKI